MSFFYEMSYGGLEDYASLPIHGPVCQFRQELQGKDRSMGDCSFVGARDRFLPEEISSFGVLKMSMNTLIRFLVALPVHMVLPAHFAKRYSERFFFDSTERSRMRVDTLGLIRFTFFFSVHAPASLRRDFERVSPDCSRQPS